MRAIDFVARLIEAGRLEGANYRHVLIHVIEDDKLMAPLGESSKMLVERAFLEFLFDSGRNAATRWLNAHYDEIGLRSTVNLRNYFDAPADDGLERAPGAEPPARGPRTADG
jgi:NTE family protein